MRKRGISPLIATVLLVGFAVVIAVVVYNSSYGNIESKQEDVEVYLENVMPVYFKAQWKDAECTICGGCDPDVETCGCDEGCYRVLIENEMNQDVSYLIRTTGVVGTALSREDKNEDFKLSPFEARIFVVNYTVSKVTNGINKNITAEIIPVTGK